MDQQPSRNGTKITANILLVAVLLTYLGSSYYIAQYPWLEWVRAFSEAASVGAIADWFAVTALFRHPLGVPIPHTAIIARQRDRLARGLGDFIDRNFLSSEILKKKIIDQNLSNRIIEWASKGTSVAGSGTVLRKLALRSLDLLEDRSILSLINRDHSALFRDIQLAPFAGKVLRFAVEADDEQQICAGIIIQLKNLLTENREQIERFVGQKLPWYVPQFLHRPAFREFLKKVRDEIELIEKDREHPARGVLRDYLLSAADRLESDPDLEMRGEKVKQVLLASPTVSRYFALLAQNIHQELKTQIADEQSALSRALEQAAVTLSTQLRQDADLQRVLNQWIFDIAISLTEHSSVKFSRLVEEVFSSWDTRTLVARIEEQVSSDLQFVRINGTLIGGLAGLVLHAVTRFFPAG